MHSANLGRRWWLGGWDSSSCWSAVPEDKDILTFAIEKDDNVTKKVSDGFQSQLHGFMKSTHCIWNFRFY